MATQLFLDSQLSTITRGTNSPKLNGVASGWIDNRLVTARGAGASNVITPTVAGTTLGVEVQVSGSTPQEWISEPLAADVTIAGSITFNLRMAESNMSANVGAQCVIERLDHLGAVISTVINSEKGTELVVTTETAENWSATPTSTAFNKGDRIRLRVAGNDVGTMAATHTFTLWVAGPTAGASGDSYVTFTETFSLMTASPAGSILYLTDVAGPAVGAAVEKEMWTARGDGVNSIIVNTAAGWIAPIQWTDSAGGTVVEWYSRPLSAFTLAEMVQVILRASESNIAADCTVRAELAVTNGDGSSAVVWAAATFSNELTTTEGSKVWELAGDDLAVTNGQRLRLRAYLDDISTSPMVAGHTATLFYDGASGGSGDSRITLTQTVSEFVTVFPPVPSVMVQRRMSAHLTM